MRLVVGMLVCLGAGNLTLALADPPASTSQPSASATAPTSTSAAAAPAKPAETSTTKLSDITPEENHFIQEGFHFEMRHGAKVLCRYEDTLGSRVNRQKMCGTVQELKSTEEQSQAAASMAARMQQNKTIN